MIGRTQSEIKIMEACKRILACLMIVVAVMAIPVG
jgi:hypothetical protein